MPQKQIIPFKKGSKDRCIAKKGSDKQSKALPLKVENLREEAVRKINSSPNTNKSKKPPTYITTRKVKKMFDDFRKEYQASISILYSTSDLHKRISNIENKIDAIENKLEVLILAFPFESITSPGSPSTPLKIYSDYDTNSNKQKNINFKEKIETKSSIDYFNDSILDARNDIETLNTVSSNLIDKVKVISSLVPSTINVEKSSSQSQNIEAKYLQDKTKMIGSIANKAYENMKENIDIIQESTSTLLNWTDRVAIALKLLSNDLDIPNNYPLVRRSSYHDNYDSSYNSNEEEKEEELA